ncbi:hypothetical protein QL285_062539 [Trifolium repens]|nr:hypothetical protein QL285_062539 [Trifolium repens]
MTAYALSCLNNTTINNSQNKNQIQNQRHQINNSQNKNQIQNQMNTNQNQNQKQLTKQKSPKFKIKTKITNNTTIQKQLT